MDINKSDLQILVLLRDNPLDSINLISKKMKLAPNTVKSRIIKMKEKGLLREDSEINDPLFGNRKITEVIGYVNPESIGLQRIYYFIQNITDYSKYTQICAYLDNHPYTVYRGLVMGFGINIFTEFNIPPQAISKLDVFFDNLYKMKLFKNVIKIIPTCKLRGNAVFEKWDLNINNWGPINQQKLEASFYNKMTNIDYECKVPEVNKNPRLKEMDLKLLRELTINGKPKINYISKFYNLDRTTISKKFAKVRDKYMSHYSVIYNKNVFHLGSEFLINGYMKKEAMNSIKKMIAEKDIPFVNSFINDNNGYFVWRIEGPTIYVNNLVRMIARHCDEINQYIAHKETNTRYFFYYKNYDAKNKKWIVDDEYIIYNPLTR